MHIFLNGLRTRHTKIGGNAVDELFESRRTISSPDMKVSFVGGDLSMANYLGRVSVPNPENIGLSPKKRIPRQYKISHIIGS